MSIRRPLSPPALFCCLVFLLGSASARAQLIPAIDDPQLFVQGGQSTEVTLTGKHLASVSSVALSSPRGLHVELLDPPKSQNPPDGELRLRVSADADAALGDREVRFIGQAGVSSPLMISVGQFPRIAEREPNNAPDAPQDISLPCTLVGKVEGAGDVDCFRFAASKGQTLVFDLYAARARSGLDPLLSILDESGHELSCQIDLHGGDPTLVFDVPADGRYVLSVRDLQFRGGGDFRYRIDAGAIPYVQSLLPMSAQPGKLAQVKPLGVNLTGAESIPLDLTYAAEGQISVRARASGGLSNALPLEVNELPAFVDEKPGHSPDAAVAVPFPCDVSGRIDEAGDANVVRFHVPRRQRVTLQAVGHRLGSSINAMLTLSTPQGDALVTVDEGDAKTARIARDLEAGDYVASIRDLFFHGGPTYAYRLQIRGGVGRADSEPDFTLRFLPDAVRISRGGNAVVFVDVQRRAEFKGDVTVALEDLPSGITCPPVVVNDKLPGASGMLVLSAAGDAPLGSFPLQLRGSSTGATGVVSRPGIAVMQGRAVEQAYLTVLDSAGFGVESAATLSPQRLQELTKEADALAAKIASGKADLAAAEAKWEQAAAQLAWQAPTHQTATSTGGTKLTEQADGSLLAGGADPDRETYTVVTQTDLAGIRAIRLEALPDPSLGANGPGRSGGGNFVLSRFSLTVAPADKPDQATPVKFTSATADFEQEGYAVASAIDGTASKGWAIFPSAGVPHEATFITADPIGQPGGSILTFTLDQQFGQRHTLGRFRLSFSADANAGKHSAVPAKIARLLKIDPADRKPADKEQLLSYYATLDPVYGEATSRLAALREVAGPAAELDQLSAALAADSPQLNAERDKWESAALAGAVWMPLDIATAKSQGGAMLKKQADGSLLASGASPATDEYTLTGITPLNAITAVRLEALPDPSLPGGGSGRGADGGFVLSGVSISATAKSGEEFSPPVQLQSAEASFAAPKYSASAALGGKGDGGWSIAPDVTRPQTITFYPASPIGSRGETELTLTLQQHSSAPQRTLGRFRIWVTSHATPQLAQTLPTEAMKILRTPAAKREQAQKTELADYYRSIAPSLEPTRRRVAELTALNSAQLTVVRGKKVSVPFFLSRGSFKGPVRVSLAGFISGRDPATSAPLPLEGAIKFTPVDLAENQSTGRLSLAVERNSGFGPRYVILRAEGTVNGDLRTEYSAPFVLTVNER